MTSPAEPFSAAAIADRRPALSRAAVQPTVRLAGVGAALEMVLMFGFLRPLSIWWHPRVVASDHPLATVLGQDWAGALAFAVPVAGAFAAYALALWAARHAGGRVAPCIVAAGTLLFALTLLPMNPVGAHDVEHNVADARTLWLRHANPTLEPPGWFADDAFSPHVVAWRSTPSVYGPVWYALAGIPLPFTGDGLWRNVIGQKALTAAFLLASALLAMAVAHRIRPGSETAAGVLVGWNPLLLFETAGNAHNGIVMAFFALAALAALSRRWWRAVFPLLALSVATKYLLVVLGPVVLLGLWGWAPRRQVLWSLGLGVLVFAAVEAPLFAGTATLHGFLREGGFAAFSPAALLHVLAWRWLRWDGMDIWLLVRSALLPAFLVAYSMVVWRSRRAGLEGMARAGMWATFLLLLLASGWFGPWYVAPLVALAGVLPGSRPAVVAVVFSASAMLMYLPMNWLLHGDPFRLQLVTVGVGFVPPLAAIVAGAAWSRCAGAAARTRGARA